MSLKKILLILITSVLTIQWYCGEKIDVGHSWKTGNLFCIIAAKLACKRGVIFWRFSGDLKQACFAASDETPVYGVTAT